MARALTRSFRRRAPARGRSQKRVVTWEASIFTAAAIAPGTLLEFNLLTEAELLARSLGRGTVGSFYGRLAMSIPEAETQGAQASGAWGVRLKEADAVAIVGTTYSPTTDAESTEWMHWRAYNVIKASGAGTGANTDPTGWVNEEFNVRNPRKIDAEEELVMLFENAVGSTADLIVTFWIRVLLVLP